MKRILINKIKTGQTVKVSGWIEKIRDQKTMQFVVLKDISGRVQITIEKDKLPKIAEIISDLTPHSFIVAEGKIVKNEFVKLGKIELIPTKIEVTSKAEPLPINETSAQDLRLDYRWIDLRDEKKALIFKCITAFEKYATTWLIKHGFIEIHTPKISGISSEGGSEVFYLDYFGQKACLTQSPQLYKQMSMMAGFDKTFEIGDVFRSNPSYTSRHHAECTCLDIEISHIESVNEVMQCEEDLLKYALSGMKKEYGAEFKQLYGKEMMDGGRKKWPRIKLLDAYKILREEMNYIVPRELNGDLDPEGERLISAWAKKKFDSDFLFVTNFPWKARAFYTKKGSKNPELGECYDLFMSGLEITSGAQREHRYPELRQNIEENGIKPESMQEYLDFFKYGAPTHGGFGMGIGRVMTKIFDFPNVREADFIYRGPTRLKP